MSACEGSMFVTSHRAVRRSAAIANSQQDELCILLWRRGSPFVQQRNLDDWRMTGQPRHNPVREGLPTIRPESARSRSGADILNVHRGAPFGRVLLHTQNLPQSGALL